jgi:porin
MRAWCEAIGWRVSVLTVTAALGACAAQAKDALKQAGLQSIWEQKKLTGDWGGARAALKDRGIEFTLEYNNEVFTVGSGGLHKQTSYEGQWHFVLNTDLEKLIGWTDAKTHVTVFQIHDSGRNVIANTGSISDPSNIDALPATRLYTAWFEQGFAGWLSVQLGQIVGDGTFFTSDTAGGLINGTFGWTTNLSADMLHGGPAYPIGVPGVRVELKPNDHVTLLGAAFSGDPGGPNCPLDENPQVCNRNGLKAGFARGSLWMGEMQYAVNQDKKAIGLPGVYKVGGWYATTDFPDQHFGFDAAGNIVSLADPTVLDALNHLGNWGIYAVADQMLWRGATSSLNLFLRAGGSPSDRNLISYYVDGGVGIKGPLNNRPDDTLTFGIAYSKISRDIVALDQDMLAFSGPPFAIRNEKIVFEVSYAAQIAPWWTLQPDLQYIYHPNGGQNPDDPTMTYDHALIAGVRSTTKF